MPADRRPGDAQAETRGADAGEIVEIAEELAAPVERVFAEIAVIAQALTDVVTAVEGRSRRVRSADLGVIVPVADGILTGDGSLVGAGVVMNPGYLEDAERYLEWRQLTRDGRLKPLLLDIDPASDDPYDYWEMEWFRVPRDEGRRMVGGPYFDYRGADRFGLTFAAPVAVGGRFVGVAGADVPLAELESELLPVLRRLHQRAALVNHESRVVTANTPHYATGARIHHGIGDPPTDVVPVVPDLGWSLLLTPAE